MYNEFQAPSIDGQSTEVKKAVFDRTFLSVIKAASKDSTRRNLAGIYFEQGRTVGTNGHILAMVESPSAFPEYKPFIISGQDLPKVSKKEHLEFTAADIQQDSARLTIANCNPDNVKIQTVRPIDADFPDYRQVMPKGEPSFKVRLDAGYLKTLMEIHLESEARKTVIELSYYDDLTPVIMESETPDGKMITTVIMPVGKG